MFHFSKEELDEEFEQFMKELSDDSFESSNKTSKQPKKEMKKKDTVPWWITEDDFDDELLRTNVSYLKTKKTSQPIMDTEEESAEKAQFLKSSGTSILSVDSLEANELVLSELHHSTLGLGLDTLEEQEEKEQFFARLEKGLTSSIDYSKLNQELDSDDSTQFRALHSYLANTEPAEDGHESESEHEGLPVVLLDSLDSVEDVNLADQSKATPEAKALPEVTGGELTGTGVSYGQSSGDTEALHQAYCHIAHSLGDTGKPRIEASTVANAKSSVKDHLQENEESSKNISTTESDLPTVEELMKPIRIDSYGVSGFDLPPISLKKAADSKEGESVSSLLHKMNTNTVSQDPTHVNQFPYKHDENVTLHKTEGEIMGGGCPAATAMEERLDKMYLEILKKKTTVNPSLLPQDDKTNQTSRTQLSAGEEGPVTGKQVPYKKARSAPPLLKRKPQSGLYMSARSSGYGKPTSSLQLFSALEKKTSKDNTKSKNVRSIPTSNQFRKKEILSGTKLIKPAALNRPSPQSEGSLTTPKQPEDPTADSSVQFQTEPPGNGEKELLMLKRAQEAEEKWRGAQALIEQIKVTFSEKERELENTLETLKRQQEGELFKLNQENYILQTKLSSFEETSRKQRWLQLGETSDPITGEKLKQIQKEIEEQETLLQGYQQTNAFFSVVIHIVEQVHKNRFLSQAVENAEPTKNQSFTDLLAELRVVQKEKNHLMEDIKRLKQDKQALEVDLEKVKKERDQAKDQIAYATGEKLYEIKILEETHKQEVSRLQKRLQWYAENQELLDKDAARLREANEEAEKLKLEIEKLKTESGSPTTQQRLRSKERALDAKRIQDLERQVKEMEGILKRRYPNSLPALILAASAAGDSADRNTVEFMERRIKKLEADLEGKDEEAKKSLRTMEQQFQKMKASARKGQVSHEYQNLAYKVAIQYEQRLEEQEQLLAHRLKEAPQNQRNSSARLKALETELGEIKEAHEVTVRKLEAEISDLKHQNAALEHKKNDREDQDLQSLEFQVLIKHFQGQVNELQGKQESLAVSQVREEILQKQITKLLEELKEAKENHTPEMKHFMGLERKIKQMEMRHKQREQELQQLKNRELDKFRTELDSILDVLRELHRQGVVVPVALADEVNTAEF
ncbi:putative protein QN1 like protein [Cricetulus griseus]|nr:putative protein QN1 like protein [Cricetulus griseus]